MRIKLLLKNFSSRWSITFVTLLTIYTNTGLEDFTPRSLSIETPNNGNPLPPLIKVDNNPPKIDFARKKDIGIDYKLILLAASLNNEEFNAFLKEFSDYNFCEKFKKVAFKIAVIKNLTLNVSALKEHGIFYPEFIDIAPSGLMQFLLKP